MSEIEKLIKKIEEKCWKIEQVIQKLEKEGYYPNLIFNSKIAMDALELDRLKAKLEGIKEGLEALKKDLIKNKPCPNKYPLISACYEQVIDDINKILGDEK